MNKNRKSKLVLFSVIGLAAVSIGTVGFATWMVGVEKKSDALTFTANVDNTLNESIYLEAEASSNEIIVAEKEAHTKVNTDILGAKVDSDSGSGNVTVNANALQFTFTTLKYSLGNGATNPTKLHLKLATATETINACNVVKTSELTGERTGATEWSYLEYNKTFTINGSGDDSITTTPTTKDSYTVYDFGTKTFTLNWGDFFGSKSPVTYYNIISAKEGYSSAYAKFTLADNVSKELTAMNTALKGKKLTIDVSLE